MLQDILPHKYHCEYVPKKPENEDLIMMFDDGNVLMQENDESLVFPSCEVLSRTAGTMEDELRYLFSVDDRSFYLAEGKERFVELAGKDSLVSRDAQVLFRELEPQWMAFAGITGSHLYRWYSIHKYCGKCGQPLRHSERERAVICDTCKITEYPKISPAVIVAVVDGDRILMTKYSGRAYNRYALIAGFMEIGESLEDTIRREVMEEVGVRVKNFRYYKSQPWAFSDSLLAGFFVDLDGSGEIDLDTEELSEASWFHRSEMPKGGSPISLTFEMIEAFRNNIHPKS